MTEEQVVDTAPDETEAEASTAEETQTGEGEPQAQEAEEKEREEAERVEKSKGYRKRLDKLTYQREEAKRQALHFQQLYEQELAQKQKSEQPPKVPVATPKPKMSDYDSDEEYIAATVDWKLEQKEAQRKADQEFLARQEQEKAQATKQFEQSRTFEEKRLATAEAGIDTYEDWEQVVYAIPGNIFNQEMAAAVFETEAPHEVAYYLGKNMEEASRISSLPPMKRAVELGKIEAKLQQPPPKPLSKAPPPVSPVKGSSVPDGTPDPSENTAAWIRARNEGRI